ncbi:MAG: glycosyltransferase family 2 protein [Candidatus Omnitrophota bacterium]
MKKQTILIIVPAFNESGNIGRVIEEISASPLPVDILVVNDGSRDDTAKEASQTRAGVISLPFNLGIGGAVQTGFQFARKHGYDVAVQVDGDGQHDTQFIGDLLAPLKADRADVTIGSRFLAPFLGYRSTLIRKIGITFFSGLISFLMRCKITDPTSGFRAYNKKAIEIFARYYPHDFPEPEAILVAKRLGLKVEEVPVQMKKRQAGQSSIRYFKTLYYMVKVTFAILLDMLKKKKGMER